MGLVIIVGPYHLALLESQDSDCLDTVLKGLKTSVDKNSLYEQAWLVHHIEEVTKEHFRNFTIRQIAPQQAAKEIKHLSQIGRLTHLYGSMADMGLQSVHMEL